MQPFSINLTEAQVRVALEPKIIMAKSLNLIGAAGEYYVCAELCKLGYVALLTPKNNPLFDVVATDLRGRNSVTIQVKTRSIDNIQGWKLGIDITHKLCNPNAFVVLVNLLQGTLPEFYIYEHDILADRVANVYQTYLSVPKRGGGQRQDVSFRWFDEVSFTEDDRKRKNNWCPILSKLAAAW